jgi:hypothetical protein
LLWRSADQQGRGQRGSGRVGHQIWLSSAQRRSAVRRSCVGSDSEGGLGCGTTTRRSDDSRGPGVAHGGSTVSEPVGIESESDSVETPAVESVLVVSELVST